MIAEQPPTLPVAPTRKQDPRLILSECGAITGYDGRGLAGVPDRPAYTARPRDVVTAENALELWAHWECSGRLRAVSLGRWAKEFGAAAGLDYAYLTAVHVGRFWDEKGDARKWAPLMVLTNARPPVRERYESDRGYGAALVTWWLGGWRDLSMRRRWYRLLSVDVSPSVTLESWQFALFRLGGQPFGSMVRDWDFVSLAELVHREVLASLAAWLVENPLEVPAKVDTA